MIFGQRGGGRSQFERPCRPEGDDLSCLGETTRATPRPCDPEHAYSTTRSHVASMRANGDRSGLAVFRYQVVCTTHGRWILVLCSREKKVRLSSKNPGLGALSVWPDGATGGGGGPDLFPLAVDGNPADVRWVLDVDINPGGRVGGSAGQYFIGTFDGTKFVNENPGDQTLWVDYGKDFYASISFSDIPPSDGRRIWMGWITHWLTRTKSQR